MSHISTGTFYKTSLFWKFLCDIIIMDCIYIQWIQLLLHVLSFSSDKPKIPIVKIHFSKFETAFKIILYQCSMNQVSCYVKILIMKILHIVTKCLISYLKSMHGFFMIYEFLARLKFSVLALNFIQTPSIGLIKRFLFSIC